MSDENHPSPAAAGSADTTGITMADAYFSYGSHTMKADKHRGSPGRMSFGSASRHKVGTRKRINVMGKGSASGLPKARNKKVMGNKKIISSMRGK